MEHFSKEQIKTLVDRNYSVHQMAVELQCDEKELELFYISCFKDNRYKFPLHILLTPEWLKEKMKTTSVLAISAYTGASPTAIHRILASYGMKTTKIKDILTPEVLYALYIEQQLSAAEIADQYKCSVDTVKKLASNYKLSTASRSLNKPDIDQKLFHLLYCELAFTISQIAQMLNCTTNYVKFTLRPKMIEEGGPLAKELSARKNSTPYKTIASTLFEKVEPVVLLELLRGNTITKVAEMYDVIPKTKYELFTKEWLEHLLSQMSLKDISEKFLVSYSYVKTLKDKYNLESVNVEDRLDAELVKKLYIENCWSDKEIAKALDTSLYSVQKFLSKHNIKPKDRMTLEQRLSAEEFAHLFLEEQLTLSQIATVYNTSTDKVSALRRTYAKVNPKLRSHKPKGVDKQRVKFLRKEVKFRGFK